ncbi:sigma-70 family RNA polymerase sigma factor [Streptomyces sp. LHD-70]|uniref:sigma-70 family RNA polymerase sigma factor n=1 Tax=Streptomyces sp. LHD-70 TaxID=3072140 RepID=UPI00280DCE14|nr:sigma-70 family RNA polymerase sigma factor [Streptomyces sp. LHD-70]MDQ8707598.1 sigma-70 family RNA polymerase sigma factor [Streptomyces sp. LHD-70]
MRNDVLVGRFEEERPRLRAVAYRMLGSLSEADDALQETWLRVDRADVDAVRNLGGWLTTVVSRVCLNMLRARQARREEPLDAAVSGGEGVGAPAGTSVGTWVSTSVGAPLVAEGRGSGPEEEALLADAVGHALLVVLDTLRPVERVVFVLHDLFAVPFDEISALVERSPDATRQLASRARRRVRGSDAGAGAGAGAGTGAGAGAGAGIDARLLREVVEAFLAATRHGDLDSLVALLHPDVVLHADPAVVPTPEPVVVRGARRVAEGAMAAMGRARFTGTALIDGSAGLVMVRQGRLAVALVFEATDGDVSRIDVIAEPGRLSALRVDLPA